MHYLLGNRETHTQTQRQLQVEVHVQAFLDMLPHVQADGRRRVGNMHAYVRTCMQTDPTDRQRQRETDRQTDRQADRQTGRQADRHCLFEFVGLVLCTSLTSNLSVL